MRTARVLHIVPTFGIGGAEQMAVRLITLLRHMGYETAAVSLYPREGSALETALEQSAIPSWYLGKHPGLDLRMWRALDRVLAAFRPDIVHTHLGLLHYAIPPLLRHRPPAIVHTVHSLAEKEAEPWARWAHRLAFRRGAVPVAVSAAVASSLQRLYGIARCRTIPNGIPVANYTRPACGRHLWRRREGFHESDVLFVSVARLKAVKNHALMLHAFARGPALHPSSHLLLLGEGPLQPALQRLARRLHIEARVHFLGLRSDVPDALAAADVFVLASNREGSPLSVLEAMAAALPVVATAVGGVPELIRAGSEGFITPPGDAAAMAAAMGYLLQHPDARRNLGAAARRRAEKNFDAPVMAVRYAGLYEKLLRGAGCGAAAAAVTG